jgi:ketosteroid isomerase-like protein
MTNDSASKEQAVRAALQRWLDAAKAGDIPALDALLTPDYTYTHASTGTADSRETWLNIFRPESPTFRRYPMYEVSGLTFRFYPGVAIVFGTGYQEIVRPTGAEVILNTTFTNVWVELGGEWKIVAWQATRIPDA